MKISIDDLKKAIDWLRANTNQMDVSIYAGDGNKLSLTAIDRNDTEVEIVLYADNQMMPKIKKTEILRSIV
jgi:hypothetical protein